MSQTAQARKRNWTFAFLAFCFAIHQINSAREGLLLPESIAAALPYPIWIQNLVQMLWALLFLTASGSLLRGQHGANRLTAILLMVFISCNAACWLLFVQADYEQNRLPLLLLGAGGLLLVMIAFLRSQQEPDSIKKEV